MLITPARPGDLEVLVELRNRAARWLKRRGIDQWSKPTHDLTEAGMLRSIAAGETFIAWDDGRPAATITLGNRADPGLWTPAEAAEPALYASKVTVARAYAGRGVGGELLDWAGTRAADQGARWLRLDAWTSNRKLHRYCLERGFTHVRTVALAHNPSGALFQRPAGRTTTPRIGEPADPGFGVLLARLAAHRKLDIGDLARLAGVPEPELRAVVDGVAPSPSLLRRLAPALDLHAADLFAIAGVPVPDDLAPLDATARHLVRQLLWEAVRLPPERRDELRRLVRSLPQAQRTQPVPAPREFERYETGFGAVLVRMLRNRNLDRLGAATTLAAVTDLYLSPSTIGVVGGGRMEVTPDRLAKFATVLGVPAGDLAALAGIRQPEGIGPPHPAAADVAELTWEARRLTADQLRRVVDEARSMPRE